MKTRRLAKVPNSRFKTLRSLATPSVQSPWEGGMMGVVVPFHVVLLCCGVRCRSCGCLDCVCGCLLELRVGPNNRNILPFICLVCVHSALTQALPHACPCVHALLACTRAGQAQEDIDTFVLALKAKKGSMSKACSARTQTTHVQMSNAQRLDAPVRFESNNRSP